ncbi:MAG: GatB/YqeY domain-containing protein [Mariprofundaceae bacterium]
MLDQKITEDMKTAMRGKDKAVLSALRMLKSALKDKQIEVRHELSDEEVQAVLGKLVKQRRDAAKQFTDAGRDDLASGELAEAELYSAYLPAQLSDEEVAVILNKVLTETGASSMKDMGRVMGAITAQTKGRADMGKVSALVKAHLAA